MNSSLLSCKMDQFYTKTENVRLIHFQNLYAPSRDMWEIFIIMLNGMISIC